jgi:hypothetical protein
MHREVIDKYTLHDVTSGSGVTLTEFVVRNNLVIKSTYFLIKEFILEVVDA